jgi:hypothetical protein
MDANEVRKYLSEDEGGKALLEELKRPLLDKRNELLEALRLSNGKVAEQAQRTADLEGILAKERKAIDRAVVDEPLAAALEKAGVFKQVIPGLVRELREAHGLAVEALGDDRKAAGKLKIRDAKGAEVETAADINTIVETWKHTDAAKSVISAAGNSGGGASRSLNAADTAPSLENIQNMTADEILANLPALTKR